LGKSRGKVGISGGFVFDCGFVGNLIIIETERPRTQKSEKL
jgi:hypothetical protein